MILRGVQGRRDRACDQLLARRRQLSQKREEDPLLSCPATSAQSSGACNAKRDRTHPPFVRPPNNTLVSSAAASSFPSSTSLHRAAPPPILPPPPSFLVSLNLIFLPPYSSSVAYRSRPDLTRDLYSPRNDLRRHFSGDSRGTEDNWNPLTRRSILYSPRFAPCRFQVVNRRRMAA